MNNSPLIDWPQDLAYLLYDCSRLLRRRFDQRIADFGLRDAQWRVISLLSHSEGLTQTELAALIGVHKAPLGEHIDRLEALGWVQRRRHPGDRRVNTLFIPPPARIQSAQIDQRVAALIGQLRAEFSQPQWDQLQQLLLELVAGFSSAESQQALGRVTLSSSLYLIGILSRQLRRQFDGALKQMGTSRSQWLVMSVLQRRPGIFQRELAQILDLPTGPLGKVIAQLVEKKWLRRQPSAEDKRLKHLYLSAEAQPMIALAADGYRDLHRELSAHLPGPQLQDLEQGLRRLRTALLSLKTHPSVHLPPEAQ